MALPKEPRQKMINVMYIVLTALLALNVSNEVLNAFRTVNQSIKRSNDAITDKNQITYDQFIKQMENDPQKVKPLKDKADAVKKMSQVAYNDIETIKQRIVTQSGGRDENGNIRGEDNLDAATRVMENKGEGPKLKKELEGLRQKYLSYVDPSKRADFAKTLPLKMDIPHTNNPENKNNWTAFYFDMTPSIAAVTMLSKFQNDIKNAESLVIDELLREINANDIKFDKFAAIVSSKSSYVMKGQPFEAQVRVGAYSSTVSPVITVNGQKIPVENGVGTFKNNCFGNRPPYTEWQFNYSRAERPAGVAGIFY